MNHFEAVMKECGYTPITTFWNDFSIADKFGIDAIKDTFNRAFEGWKTNVRYLTELVMVLNHKIWYWYSFERNEELVKAYDELWRQADQWCSENLTGEDAEYYFQTTD